MKNPSQRAKELVRDAYARRKPVMGSSEDNYDGHAHAIASAKLVAIRRIIETWPHGFWGTGIEDVLDMTGADL